MVLLIATVGLGGYVSLYELKRPAPDEQQALAKQVLQLSPEDVTALSIAFPQATTSLERREGAWHLVTPLTVRAEEPLVQQVLEALNPLQSERVLVGSTEKPLVLADYGLEPPRGTVTVTQGSQTRTLLFGAPTAVGHNHYLTLGDASTVFVVSSRLFEMLDQPLEAFRSHELLHRDVWMITQMTVTSDTVTYTLSKEAGRWQLTAPLRDAADGPAVSTLLSKLNALRIERFMTDQPTPEQLQGWGLDTPSSRISLGFGDETPALELLIGNPILEYPQQRYAIRSDEATVYALANNRLEALLQNPQTLRSRACFDFFAKQVTKLQRTWQQTVWTLEQQDGEWKAVEDAATLDAAQVEAFLWKLHDMKILRFVDEAPRDLGRFGLEPPQGMIQLWVEGQEEPQQLMIGQPLEEGGLTRYGCITGRTSVVELPEILNEILTTSSDGLKPSAAASPTP